MKTLRLIAYRVNQAVENIGSIHLTLNIYHMQLCICINGRKHSMIIRELCHKNGMRKSKNDLKDKNQWVIKMIDYAIAC